MRLFMRADVLKCVAAGILLAAPPMATSPAAAQPTGDADTRARAAFDAGHVAFGEGRYDDALADFTRAHDLSHRPELLYNIGLAADRLRHDDEAIRAFAGYLDAVPEAENRPEVERRLRALRDAVAADAAAAASLSEGASEDVEAPPTPARPIYEEWWLWTIIGGAVVLAVAIPVGVVAGSRTETDPFVTGHVGPGGIVIALGGP